jgi:serine protease
MATPYVTGAIAKIWAARPGCKKDQVIAAILETATDLGESGRDEDYGAGLVQVVKAYDYLMALPSPCGKGGGSSSAAGVRPSEEGEKDGKITASQMDEENRNRFPTAQPVTIGPPVPSSSENVWDRLKARIRGSK